MKTYNTMLSNIGHIIVMVQFADADSLSHWHNVIQVSLGQACSAAPRRRRSNHNLNV
jgi:hypothetical protein